MRIVILNTNSFGGNYEYSRCLGKAYVAHKDVTACTVLIPTNALQEENRLFKKVLLSDRSPVQNALFRKLYFLFRSFLNPIRTYHFLKQEPSALVIVNDYEQITSWAWVPLFRLLKRRHTFAVILHDPDRDRYLPVKALSEYTMNKVMSMMDAALYHELLPEKSYYATDIPKIKVPHGIYVQEAYDHTLLNQLTTRKGNALWMGMIGNIRDEKNYAAVIESLAFLPDVHLLIAGSPNGSGAPVEEYKKQISRLQLQDRVIWIEKLLTDEELQSVIMVCDIMLLYYKDSFTSQSGIINLIAPHKKPLLISDVSSGLREVVRTYDLGAIVPLNQHDLVEAIQKMRLAEGGQKDLQWQHYMEYASWDNHVAIVLASVGNMHTNKKRTEV